MSRPELSVDWEKVDYMLKCGALGSEIAAAFHMHPDTLYRKINDRYGVTFTAYQQERRAEGDYSLRQKQYEKAMGLTETGDNTLLIWLGKNRLGQKNEDKISISEDGLKALEKSMEILNHLQSKADPKVEKEITSE